MNIDSEYMFRPVIGCPKMSVLQPAVAVEGLSETIPMSEYLLLPYSDGHVLLCQTNQSSTWVRSIRTENLSAEIPTDDDEQLTNILLTESERGIATITELWADSGGDQLYLTDVIFADEAGQPSLHIRTETDEFQVKKIDTLPKSLAKMATDPFYKTIVQVRYR